MADGTIMICEDSAQLIFFCIYTNQMYFIFKFDAQFKLLHSNE